MATQHGIALLAGNFCPRDKRHSELIVQWGKSDFFARRQFLFRTEFFYLAGARE
jgi:hypothetical protein